MSPPTQEEEELCDEVVAILKENPDFWSDHECMYEGSHSDGRRRVLDNLRNPLWKGEPNAQIVALLVKQQAESERNRGARCCGKAERDAAAAQALQAERDAAAAQANRRSRSFDCKLRRCKRSEMLRRRRRNRKQIVRLQAAASQAERDAAVAQALQAERDAAVAQQAERDAAVAKAERDAAAAQAERDVRWRRRCKQAAALQAERDAAAAQAESEKQAQALQAERDAAAALIEERSLQWLTKNNFMLVDRTATAPHFSDAHEMAEMECVQVDLDKVILPPAVWKAPYTPSQDVQKSVHSEAMVVSEAAKMIEAILVGLGLGKRVSVATHRVIAGIECDITLLIGSQLIPFAAIEVKKPGPSSFDDNCIFSPDSQDATAGLVAGQNFDQLNALELMGFSSLCGMITNGNKWMITGTATFPLGEQEDWDLNRTMRGPWNASIQVSPDQKRMEFVDTETISDGVTTAVKRRLFVSQVVSLQNGEDVVKLTATFIRFACNSVAQLVSGKVKLKELPCRVLKPGEKQGPSMRCSFEKLKLARINLSSYVNLRKTGKIFLICHLGCGEFGDCCLAVTSRGNECCAVKFFLRQDGCSSRLKLARDELESWQKVYGNDVRLPKCCLGELPDDDGYLCMPYLRPIPKTERSAKLTDGSVHDALKRFADSGFKHDDVCWRHFGTWNGRLYLLDLGQISEISFEGRQGWVSDSVQQLEKRANGQAFATPEPNQPGNIEQYKLSHAASFEHASSNGHPMTGDPQLAIKRASESMAGSVDMTKRNKESK